MTLAKWMDQVDEACSTERDMLIYGLPEAEFHVAYRCGADPKEFDSVLLTLPFLLAESGWTIQMTDGREITFPCASFLKEEWEEEEEVQSEFVESECGVGICCSGGCDGNGCCCCCC